MRRPRPTSPLATGSVRQPKPKETFRIQNTEMLVMIARALIVSHMDYEKVARGFDAPASEIIHILRTDPALQKEIENQLSIVGLTDASKEHYVKELWGWFWGDNYELKQTAARILGKAFIAEKTDEQPKPLQITGIDDGVKRMFGAKDAAPVAEKIDSETELPN